ncbi:hypothetical protein NDU88_001560 [Pleurodeles waltl]|uniref:Uncharacterized protein n=1 Tax=Pleurodeles waltl TaxID=8319 RepID=A0AAV7R8Y0_PLEWA|nr:hypothetical protein NDU88_001560 [Pleurodeles waltl]
MSMRHDRDKFKAQGRSSRRTLGNKSDVKDNQRLLMNPALKPRTTDPAVLHIPPRFPAGSRDPRGADWLGRSRHDMILGLAGRCFAARPHQRVDVTGARSPILSCLDLGAARAVDG